MCQEDVPMKSQQFGYLNKTYMMAIAVDIPKLIGEISQCSTARKCYRQLMVKRGRTSLFQG